MDHKLAFRNQVSRALTLPLPYAERLKPGKDIRPIPAAVLVLLGWMTAAEQTGATEPAVLITRRTEFVETHKGQMAFPGGVIEPEDANPIAAALRETREEVGVDAVALEVLGTLPALFTLTGYTIEPAVGILNSPVESVPLKISQDEIAETFWVPLSLFSKPGIYKKEELSAGQRRYPIHVYQVHGQRIWGATGAILKNLLDRLT
ncbi:MAG: hypothetical protein A2428_16205 [Bdellovibrionales bacterium RIFOXYC1_FULL_54_43]|nr:MAG: hypothetical protein A2428_16205 [Bdellovibrionales bacterium RIFOXYC1_FULL_54_43]OFZ78705.1 MAG: hypothetical protein A2603_02015 [Bdellovibrionales bacterium RIFOXYD1_FULL_55_31]